jgi:TRAP-type C4-dicarboxylate transport system permease small subunit
MKRRLLAAINRVVSVLEDVLLWASGFALAAIMAVMATGAFSRYILGSPITGIIDLVQIYLAPAVTFLAMSAALREDEHIALDMVADRFSPKSQRSVEAVAYTGSAAIFALISYQSVDRAYSAWAGSDIIYGAIIWPLWPAYGAVAAGAVVVLLRHLLIIASGSKATTRRHEDASKAIL